MAHYLWAVSTRNFLHQGDQILEMTIINLHNIDYMLLKDALWVEFVPPANLIDSDPCLIFNYMYKYSNLLNNCILTFNILINWNAPKDLLSRTIFIFFRVP